MGGKEGGKKGGREREREESKLMRSSTQLIQLKILFCDFIGSKYLAYTQ